MTRQEIDLLLWQSLGQPKALKLIRFWYARLANHRDRPTEKRPIVWPVIPANVRKVS